jgi:methionyl-tRNA formyltransferase
MINSVLVFGDDRGLPLSIKYIPVKIICGVVAAEIRPDQHRTVQELAERLSKPFLIHPRLSSSDYTEFVKTIQQIRPDLIFVNSYSMLLHPEILAIPRYGAVNVHGALLPEYRGPNPIQWVLLSDAAETGVTMHYMNRDFDTGDIIAQQRIPVYFEDTWIDVQSRIDEVTKKMFEVEIPKLLAGTNTWQQQDESRAKKWPRRHPEDGLIDWQQSVHYIYNLVRALVNPLPGAFYLGAMGKHIVLDEYLTLQEVVNLKYGKAGGQTLKDRQVCLASPEPGDLPNGKHNDIVVLGIRFLRDNRHIGVCRVQNIDHVQRSGDMQMEFNETWRGPEYELEVIRLLTKFAFGELRLHRLSILNLDITAMQLYEKAGFRADKSTRHAFIVNDKGVNAINARGRQQECDP